MLPPSLGLKCVDSEVGLVMKGSFKDGGHEIQGEG
jgi:hypothetical protein